MRSPPLAHLASALFVLLSCAGPGTPPPAGSGPASASAATTPAAAAAPVAVDPLDRDLPVDKRITMGKLANGLTYYVLPHSKPEKRAYFWLAVNAGSVLEDDDQRGLAHFVEHMGFNGTKRFPKQDLVNFLEGIGVKFGADLNAYTSFDETVYMLQVPTDKPELPQKALQILRDWAGSMAFDPTEVDKERGVVLEEWRLGRGAGMRLFDKQAHVVFHGSKYADRITIGKPEIIKGAPRDAVVRFYKDWYRPDLMAVVAVGDFAPEDIEKRIAAEFGDLKNPAPSRPRPVVAMPAHKDTLVTIETDAEMPYATAGMTSKFPHRPERSAHDYRRQIGEQLYHAMLNARFDELRRRPNAPFLFAGSSTGNFVRSADAFSQNAVTKDTGVATALQVLLEEVVRVERHGFLASELERAKKDMLRGYLQAVVDRDKRDGREFASEIVRHFLESEMMPGVEAEKALAETFLPTFTLAELNGLAKQWAAEASRVISVSGPDKMTKPAPEALLAIARSVQERPVAAYEDAVAATPLLPVAPRPGKVVDSKTVADIGVTVWKLANGARVIIKPTDFKNDEIRMQAFSPGGHSLVKDADYDSALASDSIVEESGLGALDAVKLHKALAGKIAGVNAWVGELAEGLSGRASPTDLETFLQLVHLEFTAARRDDEAFKSWRARETEMVKNRRLSPEQSFYEDMQLLLSSNHRRRQPVTPESLAKVDLDRALAIYKDRFADAGDFTFVFVGNIKLETLQPLVETYLGSLPSKGRKESWKDVGVKWPKGMTEKTMLRGSEPKSAVLMAFHGAEKWSKDTENDLRMLGEVLRIRLREILREDMGGVYGVGAGGGISRRPRQEFTFTVQFGCAPDNVDKLRQAVLTEVQAVKDKGIGDEYVKKAKEARVRSHEVNLKENGFWLGELTRAYDYGDDPSKIPDVQPWIDKISSDRVKAAARKYLDTKAYVFGVLKPETTAGAAGPGKPASAP